MKPSEFIRRIELHGRSRSFLHFWAMLLAGLLAVACSRQVPVILSGTPCAIPCWQNITPGITSDSAALSILSDPTIVEQDSLRESGLTTGSGTLLFPGHAFWLTGGDGGTVLYSQGRVLQITVTPAESLPLAEVIEAFGEPERIYVTERTSGVTCYLAWLFYPLNGLLVSISGCPTEGSELSAINGDITFPESINVHKLDLYKPQQTLAEALVHSLRFNEAHAEYILKHSQEWTGANTPYAVSPDYVGAKH
jgi:hypothetical protein